VLPTPPAVVAYTTPIQHVVIILQNGRTLNNLFNGFCETGGSPCAYTTTTGNTGSGSVAIGTIALNAQFCSPGHDYNPDFQRDYASGANTGFQTSLGAQCNSGGPPGAFAKVQTSDSAIYWAYAQAGGLASMAGQSDMGAAMPAHQELIAGQSGNPLAISEGSSYTNCTCAVPSPAPAVNLTASYPAPESTSVPTCVTYPTIFDNIETAGLTWRYYMSTDEPQWEAPQSVSAIYNNPTREGYVITPPSQVLTDVAAGTLANLTYVSPTALASDAAGHTNGTGPSWVQQVIGAVQNSRFWNTTAIFVVWTDWGGWYDPVVPTLADGFHAGYRVPIVVVSPYAKPGYLDTTPRTTMSILRFVETAFSLPSLNQADVREPDDMTQFFNWTQTERWL
jgi:phospholipase C